MICCTAEIFGKFNSEPSLEIINEEKPGYMNDSGFSFSSVINDYVFNFFFLAAGNRTLFKINR